MSHNISPAPHLQKGGSRPFPKPGSSSKPSSLNTSALGGGVGGLSSPPRIPPNPFAFRAGDASMKKENAVQYFPPHKRMEMRQYLSRSSVKFKQRPMMNERDIIYFKDQSMYQSPMADLNDSKVSGNVLQNITMSPVPNNKRRFKHIKHAPSSGSEPRINKVHAFVDRLFGETPKVQKPQHYTTINDRFLGDPSISDPASRKQQYDELQAEVKANDAQVLKTNVRIGRYPGWKPRDPNSQSKKALPPKQSKFSTSDITSPSTQISQGLPKEIPNLIWSESDMFKTSKQQFQDDPLSKINYSDYVPKVEEKKNKKNESCLNFAHRIDLKILNSMNGTSGTSQGKDIFTKKRGGSTNINQDLQRDQVFTLGQLQDDIRGSHQRHNSTQQPLSSQRQQESSETLIQIEEKFKTSPGKTEGRNDEMKPPKYLAAKASYEKLIQQAKTKLIRTFLDREKRRQDQYVKEQLETPINRKMILQEDVRDFKISKKKISNCYIINQERFHPPGTAGAQDSNTASQSKLKTIDQNGRRSSTSSKQGPRPKSSLKQLQSLVKTHQAEKKLHAKMKQQNFHISGPDYDYLAAAGVQKSTDQLEINPSISNLPHEKSLTTVTSPMKPPKPQSILSRDKSKQHYRTSFQEQFEMTQCFGQDSNFKKEVQDLKDFMKKPNIHFLYSTAKVTASRALRSVSPGYDDMRLRASYDNVNLKNHLPFADKQVRDILSPDERFKTFYAQDTGVAALRQDSKALMKNLERNNSLNKGYKKRLLDENYKIGLQNKTQEMDNLRTVEQQRQFEANNPDSQFTATKLMEEGRYPAQMRVDNKKLVEAQNFKITQPQLSGDVFDPHNYREKSRPLNGPYQILDTIIEDDHNVKSTEGGLREGSPMRKNMSAMQFSKLSFKDQMMDHRKTNFPMGNQFQNAFQPTQGSRAQRALIDSKFRTIDVGFMAENPSSPLGAGGRTFNIDVAQNALVNTSNHMLMTPQHGFRTKAGFDRPQTTIDISAYTRLRGRDDYLKNKNEGETSKIQMGNEKRFRQPSASPLGGGAGATDYRSNFTWTVPKYAQ